MYIVMGFLFSQLNANGCRYNQFIGDSQEKVRDMAMKLNNEEKFTIKSIEKICEAHTEINTFDAFPTRSGVPYVFTVTVYSSKLSEKLIKDYNVYPNPILLMLIPSEFIGC